MNEFPAELRYTSTHEWVRVAEDGLVTVGITDFAQDALGDIVFVELPEIGQNVGRGEEVAVVESVKAASDVYAPVTGEIVKINMNLEEDPELVNGDPFGDGWFFTVDPVDVESMNGLFDASDYEEHCASEADE